MALFVGIAFFAAGEFAGDIDMPLLQQFANWLVMVSVIRIALLWRLPEIEYRVAMPLYAVMAGIYFVATLMGVAGIYYLPLLPLSFAMAVVGFSLSVLTLRRLGAMASLDRIFALLAVLVYALAGMLSFVGFAYIALTAMLGLLVVVTILQLLYAFGDFVRHFRDVDKRNLVSHAIIERVIYPAGWIGMILYLINWLAYTFHLAEKLGDVLTYRLVWPSMAEFSIGEVFFVVGAGVGVYFFIAILRALIREIWKESIEFGLLPSFVILGSYIVWMFYIVFALTVFKVQYAGILAVLGGMSVGLGFGLKEIVENFIAGIILLVGQQVRPGDTVEVVSEKIYGKVVKVTVRSTVVETSDGALIIYPNSQVLTKDFRNWTSGHLHRRCSVIVGVQYETDVNKACEVLKQVAEETLGVNKQPEVEVLCSEFGNDAVNLEVRAWVNTTQYALVRSELHKRILIALDKHKIEFPYSQLDVHLK